MNGNKEDSVGRREEDEDPQEHYSREYLDEHKPFQRRARFAAIPTRHPKRGRQRDVVWTVHTELRSEHAPPQPSAPSVARERGEVRIPERQQFPRQGVGIYQPVAHEFRPRMSQAQTSISRRPFQSGDGSGVLNTQYRNTQEYQRFMQRAQERQRSPDHDPSAFVQMARTPEKIETEAAEGFGASSRIARSVRPSRRHGQRRREDSDSWSRSPVSYRRFEEDVSAAFQPRVERPQHPTRPAFRPSATLFQPHVGSAQRTRPVYPPPVRVFQPRVGPSQLPSRPFSGQPLTSSNIGSSQLLTLLTSSRPPLTVVQPRSGPAQLPTRPVFPSPLRDFKPRVGPSQMPTRPPSAQPLIGSQPRAGSSELAALLTAPRQPVPQAPRQAPGPQGEELLMNLKNPRYTLMTRPRGQPLTSSAYDPSLGRQVKRPRLSETEKRDVKAVPTKMARTREPTAEQLQSVMIKSAFSTTAAAFKHLEDIVLKIHEPTSAQYEPREEAQRFADELDRIHVRESRKAMWEVTRDSLGRPLPRQQQAESVRRRPVRELSEHLAVPFEYQDYKDETGATNEDDQEKQAYEEYEAYEDVQVDEDEEDDQQD